MIILATVIILSLDSSNIVERANEAKEATNLANLKEAANVALAEYQLEVSLGNIDSSITSANEYVKDKLEEQGIDTRAMTVTEDEKILTGLTEVAVAFIEAEVPVGASVTGYDLSSNTETTYATTGNENTAPNYTETDPTTQNVARTSTLTWKYIGVNDDGEALIVLDTVSSMPTMKLSGKGGYLNGLQELNDACDALYSSDMGKARSMNINDVNMILGTNPVGTYANSDGNTAENIKELTIGELVAAGETALTVTSTPDGKDINTYVPNYYTIAKTSVTASDTLKNLVYQSVTYWLSSQCVNVYFNYGIAGFGVCNVSSSSVEAYDVFDSNANSICGTHAIRPIVQLSSDVEISYDGTTVTLSK